MQVAHAAGTLSKKLSVQAAASYAPLYLTSSLNDKSFDIEELEGISLDRLKVLKAAEAARTSQSLGPKTAAALESLRSTIRAAERAAGLKIPPLGNRDRDNLILKDEASHFLLRLALCRTQEHRNWLLAAEHALFSSRLDGAGAEFALDAIKKADGPDVRLASAAEIEQFRAELDAVARGPGWQKGDGGVRYYTVAFEEVSNLVRQRKVFLHRGIAYVPEGNILDVVKAQFRAKLSQALAKASKVVALADEDSRMRPILDSIRAHYAIDENGKGEFDPSQCIESISLNQLNESVVAMPLCMSNMMARLREQHHLRHSARMQLGVFLKGCGLTLDESLRFWRTEFGKGAINAEKFEKTYAYNIRHHYGKEGKRRNLNPFPCMRIINDRPGPGEHNGCPYREFEETRLRTALRSAGTDPNHIPAIIAKTKEGNFQTACGMCFAASQPGHHPIATNGVPEYIPTHPNEYFIEARKRRFAPEPEAQMLDDDMDEEMLLAAEALETQESLATPAKSNGMEVVGATNPQNQTSASPASSPTDIIADTTTTKEGRGGATETPEKRPDSGGKEDMEMVNEAAKAQGAESDQLRTDEMPSSPKKQKLGAADS